ncbi:MAG: sporulation protein YqfD, partial [Bacillota bacterium]|nr:sporulation protein YqfD [Bacillota bacterium]
MFSRLWRNFIGYVIIKIEGLSLEKLMNAAAAGGIRLIDCKRRAYTQIEAQVSFIGFLKLKKLLADAPCVLTGIKKCGLPFFFLSLWERKGLIFGAVVSAMLIYALTSFIWVIEIDTKGEVDVAGIQRK